jgi:hypothetical protein
LPVDFIIDIAYCSIHCFNISLSQVPSTYLSDLRLLSHTSHQLSRLAFPAAPLLHCTTAPLRHCTPLSHFFQSTYQNEQTRLQERVGHRQADSLRAVPAGEHITMIWLVIYGPRCGKVRIGVPHTETHTQTHTHTHRHTDTLTLSTISHTHIDITAHTAMSCTV